MSKVGGVLNQWEADSERRCKNGNVAGCIVAKLTLPRNKF